ncbi:MAG: hypothetical protein LKE54_03735 [Prevotella sp.]|jgi:hypothetical protein|nr:hypothetical protein [Prevotella sp.]MCH3994158.1 hypothetical protein [Prevotella sp.]
MKYYIISSDLAHKLNLTSFRKGNQDKGYLVGAGEIIPYLSTMSDTDKKTIKEVSSDEARKFIATL